MLEKKIIIPEDATEWERAFLYAEHKFMFSNYRCGITTYCDICKNQYKLVKINGTVYRTNGEQTRIACLCRQCETLREGNMKIPYDIIVKYIHGEIEELEVEFLTDQKIKWKKKRLPETELAIMKRYLKNKTFNKEVEYK
jgi:hypothetical protein